MKRDRRTAVCFDCRLQEPVALGKGRIVFRCAKAGSRHVVADRRYRQKACADFEPLVMG